MHIHKEGFKVIPVLTLGLLILIVVVYLLLGQSLLFLLLLVVSVVFTGAMFWFFRDPGIRKQGHEGEILSVADGKVVVIEPVTESEHFRDERMQVSVFMSVFDVHINHIPIPGEIVFQKHHNGRFFPASLAKSSGENERCTTVIRTGEGTEIMIRQIAGILARRIVTYKKPGEMVSWKDQLGFIRFGSRVDLFLPLNAEIHVNLGQRVKGGITVIARI